MSYTAPIAEMRFVLEEVAGIGELAALPGYGRVGPGPCRSGPRRGGEVRRGRAGAAEPVGRPHRQRPRKRRRAHPAGLPRGLSPICRRRLERARRRPRASAARGCRWRSPRRSTEMWNSACMALGAVPALEPRRDRDAASARLAASRRRSISASWSRGEWTGTMNLTEPQAGSDLGALRDPRGAGERSRAGASITGSPGRRSSSPTATTISPTTSSTWCWRALPDAPPGSRGISLFLVPKFLLDEEGRPGRAQRCPHAAASRKSSASTPRRPACCPMARMAARSAGASARSIAGSKRCSR